jgi:hypothetical protein
LIPALLNADQYKKGASPEEARRMFKMEVMKTDFTFSKKSVQEQNEIIDKLMMDRAPAQPGQPAPAAPATSGVPPEPVYVRHKTTGQIFQIQGDKKIPVGPPPKPPAAPAAPAAPVPPAGAQSAIPPSPAAMAAGGIPARGSGLNLVPR